MQGLYAYHQSDNKQVQAHEKALLQSVDRVFEMYIWMLALLQDVADYARIDADERANRFLASNRQQGTNLKITGNSFLKLLSENEDYLAAVKKYKVSWSVDPELPRALFTTVKAAPEYESYLTTTNPGFSPERDILKFIFKKVILKSTLADQAFEERFMNWPVDAEVLQAMMAKTFKNFADSEGASVKLAEISANWTEDR
ncbi:MAG: transcription antitermination factor NusB, partial [Mucilaginibacter polytrichastri]|nr:transcription antitermination factor NusB [Mucilaginibacter polytrichastri]